MHTHPGERPNFVPTYVTIEERRLRKRAEAAVEALLELLDELAPDPEMEPDNDDEPALGWEGGNPGRYFRVSPWNDNDRSYDDTDREQDAGDEAEAGDGDREHTALERHGKGFVYSGSDDREDEIDHVAEWEVRS